MRDLPTSGMNHVFIIDNSQSMTQKTSHCLTLLEVAKKFAETYIITRMKMPETKADRYFIFTTDTESKKDLNGFATIQDIPSILDSLRSITPNLYASLSSRSCDLYLSLKSSIDFLNAFRAISHADNYFGGRDVVKAECSNVITSNSDLRDLGLPGPRVFEQLPSDAEDQERMLRLSSRYAGTKA